MNKLLIIVIISLLSSSLFANTSLWEIQKIDYEGQSIRAGIKKHFDSEYVDTIMYLEGLGDSMLNHDPLFNHLNENGYDIIAFDYRGQGGSTGDMGTTRISNINELSEKVWDKLIEPENKDNKKILLGWSTGGLAAYRYAYMKPELTKAVILLAPGIHIKPAPGETTLFKCWVQMRTMRNSLKGCNFFTITEKSLTQNRFENGNNPHKDIIKPDSPTKALPFTMDLLRTSLFESSYWRISKEVKGVVYLSSDSDTYVDAKRTMTTLDRKAEHFDYYQFGLGSLHELDNEKDAIADYIKTDMIRFLDSL